jgi:hypothetical protein
LEKKKPGPKGPAKSRSDKRRNLPEGTADAAALGGRKRAALKSADADIGRIPPFCNAKCLMKGLRGLHGSGYLCLRSPISYRSWQMLG